MDNSPHVLFFAPIIRQLERDGIEVMLTAREFSQTVELARTHGLTFLVVGEHKTPRSKFTRVSATLKRAASLAGIVRQRRPDVAVSHGSRAMVLASWILGIPSMTLYDYEFVSAGVFKIGRAH